MRTLELHAREALAGVVAAASALPLVAAVAGCTAPPAAVTPPTAPVAVPARPGRQALEPAGLALRAVLETPGTISIHPLDGKTLVRVEDRLFEVRGDALVADPKLQRGLEPRHGKRWYIQHVEGFWPDRAVLVASDLDPAQSDPGGAHYFVWSPLHERWLERGQAVVGRWVTQLARWTDRRVLAVEQTNGLAEGNRVHVRVVAGAAADPPLPPELSGADPYMGVTGLATLPSGALLLSGDTFHGENDQSFASWIVSWEPGRPHGAIVAAPDIARLFYLTGAFVVRSANEIYLTGAGRWHSPYLLRHDGRSWTKVDSGLTEPLDGLWDEPGGRLWVRASCQLDVAVDGGATNWKRVLPGLGVTEGLVPTNQVWPRAKGDVWIVAERTKDRAEVLLRTVAGNSARVDADVEPLPRKFKLAACRDRW